jgi:hypothetical protein
LGSRPPPLLPLRNFPVFESLSNRFPENAKKRPRRLNYVSFGGRLDLAM